MSGRGRSGAPALSGSRVLLTGASGGIGAAIARRLAGRGCSLILTGRRTDVLAALAEETGGVAVACDLADPAAVDRLVAEHGDVDALVANAALPGSGRLDELDDAEIDAALAVNLRAPMVLARRLAPAMVERGDGQLLFVSSLAGKAASPGGSLYSATKFGLRGFALGLRAELAPAGVNVSTIFPGFIRGAGMFADSGAVLPPGVGTKTPEQVADALVRAAEGRRAEIDVAPVALRLGAALAGLAPGFAAQAQRRLGSDDVSAAIAAGQRRARRTH